MSQAACERTGDLIIFTTNMARLQEAGKTDVQPISSKPLAHIVANYTVSSIAG